MAKSIIQTIRTVFDRASAKKAEAEMAESLGKAGSEGGKKAGQNYLRDLRREFDKKKADLQVALAKGTISEKEFRKETAKAAATFRAGILKLMDEAKAKGKEGEAEYIKLSRALKRVGDEGQRHIGTRLTDALKKAAAAAAVLFGVRQIQRFARESVAAFEALRTGQRQLEGQLRNTGVAWADVSDEVRAHARELWDTHRLTQGEVNQTLRQLVLVTGDYEKSLKMVGLAHDLMAATGLNAERASRLLGRALNGELTALNRYGIQLSENRDVAEQLTEKLQGQARAAASNAITWQKAVGDLKETIGGLITAAFGLDEGFSVAAEAVRKLNDALTENMEGWVRFGRVTVATVRTVWNTINIALQAIEAGLTAMIGGVLSALNILPVTVNFVIRQLNRLPGVDIDVTMGRLPADKFFERMETAHEKARGSVHAIADAWKAVGREAGKAEEVAPLALGESDDTGEASTARAAATDKEADALARLEAQREALIAQMSRDIEVQGRRAEAIRQGEEAVEALNRELHIEEAVLRSGAEAGSEFEATIRQLAAAQYDAAEAARLAAMEVESSWADAAEAIEAEVAGHTQAIGGLFEAWARDGIKGLAQFAKTKVLQNLAWAAEAVGRAIFGDPRGVAAATQHGVAAAKWGIVAGAASAGSSGGGAGASAGPSLSGPNTGPAGRAEPIGPEVNIYIDPLNPLDPAGQRFVFGAMQEAREVFGEGARINVHRRSG